MADLSAIQAEVTNETTVVASVVKLVNSLADQITAAGTDPVALQSIVDTMRANDTALADAVTAHTPAVVPAPVPAAQAATNPDGSPVELHPSQGGNPNSTPAT